MKAFNNLEEMINSKASETLKSYAYDQPESIDWSFAGLRKEILKERQYISKKVSIEYHPYLAILSNVPIGKQFIKNFGYVNN